MMGDDPYERHERSKRSFGRFMALGEFQLAVYVWRIGHLIIAAAMIYFFHAGDIFWAEVLAYTLAAWGLVWMSRATRKAASWESQGGDGDAGELSWILIVAAVAGLWYVLH